MKARGKTHPKKASPKGAEMDYLFTLAVISIETLLLEANKIPTSNTNFAL